MSEALDEIRQWVDARFKEEQRAAETAHASNQMAAAMKHDYAAIVLDSLHVFVEGLPPGATTVDHRCHHDWQLELHNHEKQEWTLWVHGSFDDVISDYVGFRDSTLGDRYDKARLVGPYRCFSTTCPGCSQ